MASIKGYTLVDAATVAGSTEINYDAVSLDGSDEELIAYVVVSDFDGTSIDIDLEHSPDGVNWFTLDSFTQLTADGSEAIVPNQPVFPRVRAEVTPASMTDSTVTVKLYVQPRRR